jgi:hypothetical protein
MEKNKVSKKKKVRVESDIYCMFHGCIHLKTGDPYDMGCEECSSDDWRTLFIELGLEEFKDREKYNDLWF